MSQRLLSIAVAVVIVLAAAAAHAQTPAPPPDYGAPITLEQAKKVMAGSEAEAAKNKWSVVITIVVGGKLIGGVGVSGVTSQQDAQIAQAGIDALAK